MFPKDGGTWVLLPHILWTSEARPLQRPRIRGILGVQPGHIAFRIIPQREDEHHSSVKCLAHLLEVATFGAVTLLRGTILGHPFFMSAAELICERVTLHIGEACDVRL